MTKTTVRKNKLKEETSDEREIRLEIRREQDRKRAAETDGTRKKQRCESDELRDERLLKDRLGSAQRRAKESNEQHQERLQKDLVRSTQRRETETKIERDARVSREKQYLVKKTKQTFLVKTCQKQKEMLVLRESCSGICLEVIDLTQLET